MRADTLILVQKCIRHAKGMISALEDWLEQQPVEEPAKNQTAGPQRHQNSAQASEGKRS